MSKEQPAYEQVQKKALVCPDFDTDCFGLDGNFCAQRHEHDYGNGITYAVEEAEGVCPMAR